MKKEKGKKSRLAISSFVLGIFSLIPWIGLLPGSIAIILGIVALIKIREIGLGGRGFAISGIILGFIGAIFSLVMLLGLFFVYVYIPYHFEESAKECSLKYPGIDSAALDAKENCIFELAYANYPAVEECLKLEDRHLIYSCKMALAASNENYSACDEMIDLEYQNGGTYKDICLEVVAFQLGDLEKCKEIPSVLWQEICKTNVGKKLNDTALDRRGFPQKELLDLGKGMYGLRIPGENWYFLINLTDMHDSKNDISLSIFHEKEGYGLNIWAYPTFAPTMVNSDETCRDSQLSTVEITRSNLVDSFKDEIFTEIKNEQNAGKFFSTFESYNKSFTFTEDACLNNWDSCYGFKTIYYYKYNDGYCYIFYINHRLQQMSFNKADEIINSIKLVSS
jgi:hypothetical protein